MSHKLTYAIIVLLLFNSVLNISFAQNRNDIVQKYEYEDDTIDIVITCNDLTIDTGQVMKLGFVLKNVSTSNIFIFRKPIIGHSWTKDSIYYNLVLKFGEDYERDFDWQDTLQMLKPHQKAEFFYEFNTDSLIKPGFKHYLNIVLGLGFIPYFERIFKYKEFFNGHNPNFIDNGYLELNTTTIQAALSRKEFRAFSLKFAGR